jgi:predicted nucleic acid-binding protein
MGNRVLDVGAYEPVSGDKLFFDTNVWLYLYCPIGNYRKKKIARYDSFLKKAIQAKATICVSSLVLSEFCNTYARLEFNILKRRTKESLDFKRDFKRTPAYKKVMTEIRHVVTNQILKIASPVDDKFDAIDRDKLMGLIAEADFNDAYYCLLSRAENMMVVTDDGDFATLDADLITGNQKLLT